MYYCVPEADTLTGNAATEYQNAKSALLNSSAGAPLYDLYKSRWVLFSSVFVAIFFAFLYIKFMDWCAFQCAWISVITVGLGVFGIGTLLWMARSNELTNNPNYD